MLYLKACLALLLARVEGHEIVGSNGLRGVDVKGSVRAAESAGVGNGEETCGDADWNAPECDSTDLDLDPDAPQITGRFKNCDADQMTASKYAACNGLTLSPQECPSEARHVPFAITNIEGVHDDASNTLRITYNSLKTPVNVYFLKDVTFCDDGATGENPFFEGGSEESSEGLRLGEGAEGAFANYVLTGTKVSADEFKELVAAHLEANGQEAVFYGWHGFNVDPGDAFNLHVWRYKEWYQDLLKWQFIPIMWYTHWEASGVRHYDYSRNTMAIRAGKLFAENVDVFKAPYTSYIYTHSMGNWAYQVMAMELDELGASEELFEKHFMVAADARRDMFRDEYNPDAPRTLEEKMNDTQKKRISLKDKYDSDGDQSIFTCNYPVSESGAVSVTSGVGIPVEECKLNGGYSITKLARKVHVLWNKQDFSLDFRENYQYGSGESGLSQALGKFGDVAQENMNLQYFRERVTFSEDMSTKTVLDTGAFAGGFGDHAYYADPAAIHEYDPEFTSQCEWTQCVGEDICEPATIEVTTRRCGFANMFVSAACCVFSHSGEEVGFAVEE